jgi:hypothetical protein
MLDVSGITCPSGRLFGASGGLFDRWGIRYEIPSWCVGWPMTIPRQTRAQAEAEDRIRQPTGIRTDQELDFWESVSGFTQARKPSVVSTGSEDPGAIRGEDLTVTVRLSSTGRDMIVKAGSLDTVKTFILRVKIAGEVCSSPISHGTF